MAKRPVSKRQTTKRAPRPRKRILKKPVVPAPGPSAFQPELPAATVAMEPAHEERAEPAKIGRVTLFSFTLVGILLGIALGYYLGSQAAKVEPPAIAPQTTTVPATIDADRTRKVLVLIQEELIENARILRQQRELREKGGSDLSVSSQIVKNELWRAISSSSDAQALRDTVLLHSVAAAYGHIDEIGLLQRKALEAMSFAGKPAAARESERALFAALAKSSAAAEKSIVDAAVQIDQRLNAKH
jgi:hypothetical protein